VKGAGGAICRGIASTLASICGRVRSNSKDRPAASMDLFSVMISGERKGCLLFQFVIGG
jgi:hypothetical protein